jgi:glycerophosphoryl diester phosphodiesterase
MPSIKFHPPFIAHRGAKQYAPENTLASFLKAKELGAQWIEFDVMLTGCGEAIIMHDETLERTTNGQGSVLELPYSYIQTLDAGSWFDKKFAGEKVPTLKETILFLKKNNMYANVEIKVLPGYEEKAVSTILSEIDNYWPKQMQAPLISSFSVPVLQYVREASPHAMLGLLIDEWFPAWEIICEKLQCVSVNLNQAIITEDKINMIKAMQRCILSYTVNTTERAQVLFDMGVDALFTDDFSTMFSHFMHK